MCPSVHLPQDFKVTKKTESSDALEQLTLLDVWTSVESKVYVAFVGFVKFPLHFSELWNGLGLVFEDPKPCFYLCFCYPHTLLSFSVKLMVYDVLSTQRGFAAFGWRGGDVWDVFEVHDFVCTRCHAVFRGDTAALL